MNQDNHDNNNNENQHHHDNHHKHNIQHDRHDQTNRPLEEKNETQIIEPHIVFDDFLKVQMKAGKVLTAETLEKSEKLLRLTVDFGETEPRQVISGIRHAFPDPAVLIGNTYAFVTNLEPRKILGLESQAMIMAAKDEQGMVLFTPTGTIIPGTPLA